MKTHSLLNCEYVKDGKLVVNTKLDSYRAQERNILSSSHGTNDETRIAQLERTVQILQNRVKDLERDIQLNGEQNRSLLRNDGIIASCGNGVDDRDADEQWRTAGSKSSRPDTPQTFIAPPLPRLKSTGERVKLFGTTHWALVFLQVLSPRPMLSLIIR